jgi:hypothetical protein
MSQCFPNSSLDSFILPCFSCSTPRGFSFDSRSHYLRSFFARLQWLVSCVVPLPRPAVSFTAPECGAKVFPQPPIWAEAGLHPCFTAYSHVVDTLLKLDVLFMFDGFESAPAVPQPGKDDFGLECCVSACSHLAAGEVCAVVRWLMQVHYDAFRWQQ